MDYAIQLLLPILGGLLLGNWLSNRFGLSPIWTLVFAILGMIGGIGILYKKFALMQPPQKIIPKKPPGAETPGKHISELDFLYKLNKHDHQDDEDDDDDRWREIDRDSGPEP